MLTIAIQKEFQEATMWKVIGSTRTRPAMQWYITYPKYKFVEQFVSSKNLENQARDLYEILQYLAEPFLDTYRAWPNTSAKPWKMYCSGRGHM